MGADIALKSAIARTADAHRAECDLSNPATPAAAVAIVEFGFEMVDYLVLSDTTVVLDGSEELTVITDTRINSSAVEERRIADSLPSGSPEKARALIAMKKSEIAVRNSDAGYWVAAANPEAVDHALTGKVPASAIGRAAVLTDGAARIVTPFASCSWSGALELLGASGPAHLIRSVRDTERADADGQRWPRNKLSDDATVVFVQRA
jgi:hypothetical protein